MVYLSSQAVSRHARAQLVRPGGAFCLAGQITSKSLVGRVSAVHGAGRASRVGRGRRP